jgi:uracil-DNA glycosylase family 4
LFTTVTADGNPYPRSSRSIGLGARVTRNQLALVTADVVECRRCPRLVAWRERVASQKVARFADDEYWGRPVPGSGDPDARILIVGLAPAAHGGNRTGRIFTGDASADFLFPALYGAGLSNSRVSRRRDDGLRLIDTYIAAVNRCAPPDNKPTPVERDNCLPYLEREIAALERVRVIVALGAYAWDGTLRALGSLGHVRRPRPRFAHGAEEEIGPFTLIGSFHPSQQNTFTGRLTRPMLDAVFDRAVEIAGIRARGRAARAGADARGGRGPEGSPKRRPRPVRSSSAGAGSDRARG